MAIRSVLVTGGAGFIGSHLADELLEYGYHVRALDNLTSQVHGESQNRPAHLAADVELHVGDVRDRAAVKRALQGVDAVFHFAAAVGVDQSTYDVERFTSVNDIGTAVLTEALVGQGVERLVVASTMSVYGEGLFRDREGRTHDGRSRPLEQLHRGDWELEDDCGRVLTPLPTPETKSPSLDSIYALSKFAQERMCLLLGRAYEIPTTALRLFNVYGPRQSLSNPYTSVLTTFASRLMGDERPMVFEDGNQRRDFVNVKDVARACRLTLEKSEACDKVLNIGSGKASTIADVAKSLATISGKPALTAEITGKYRIGDVRHCFADISLARRILGYEPEVALDGGLADLVHWLRGQAARDRSAHARRVLDVRGLTHA